MYYLLGFVGEILLLFLLSQTLHKELGKFFFMLFRSEKLTIYFMALLFLPGTFIHELSHYVMAHILGVRTGTFSIFPKFHGTTITLGSVMIEKTDRIRRFFIGVAPFLIGMSLLLGSIYIVLERGWVTSWWIGVLFVYLLFTLSNTMFSSRRDMEGALELVMVVLLIGIVCYFFGIRIPTSFIEQYSFYYLQANTYLGITLGIDIVVLTLVWLINHHLFKIR